MSKKEKLLVLERVNIIKNSNGDAKGINFKLCRYDLVEYMTTGRKTNGRINNLSTATNCQMDFSSPTFYRKQEK